MQERTFNEYSLRLEPIAEAPATDVWSELRLLCRNHGGWAFIREDRGGVITESTPPFFRFEEDDSCPDPEMAALLFKEGAGKRLAEIGLDSEIEIDELTRPHRFDVTVKISDCEAGTDYDPTPWCSGCGSRTKSGCHCGPLAEND